MRIELDQNEFLYELCEHDEVIVYKDDSDPTFKKFISCLSESVVKVCVKDMETLKNIIMNDLCVSELPFAIYCGHIITKQHKIQKEIERINYMKNSILERKIQKIICLNNIAIFMEGKPDMTNEKTLEMLKIFVNKPYAYYNVLLNERIRYRIIEMTGCITFPQVFIDGTFVGGIDEIYNLQRSGNLFVN